MIKEQVIKDIKFKQRCGAYGLDWNNCAIYDDVILLNTPREDLFVLFDKNYNTIGVVNWKVSNEHKPLYIKIFSGYEYSLAPFTGKTASSYGLVYPFEEFTLKQIIDLSNRIEIMETNQGHSLSTKINGEWYDRNAQDNKEYFQLVSYIKFLGEEIQRYFLLSYQLQVMGYESPDIYSYVRNLISKVNNCLDIYIEEKERPYPKDILSFIGQDIRNFNMNGILYDVIDLLLKDKGYKIKSDNPNKIEMANTQDKKDLSMIAQEILEILKLSDEELKMKEEQQEEELLGDSTKRKGFNPDLWQPVITEHPPVSKGYPKHKRHEGFVQYQPISERYVVPGLLPKKQKIEEQCEPVLTKKLTPPKNTGNK